MEEVDQTIIPILVEIGCKISAKKISEFVSDDIVQACSVILHTIDKQNKFPLRLPEGNAAKFRICTQLAQTISEMGYSGDNGYQVFLYPNEKDMRKLLMWLIDKLPKSNENEGEDLSNLSSNPNLAFNQSLRLSLQKWVSTKWNPFTAGKQKKQQHHVFSSVALSYPTPSPTFAAESMEYMKKYQPIVSRQTRSNSELISSLFEHTQYSTSLAQEKEKEWEAEGGTAEEVRSAKINSISSIVSHAFRTVAAADNGVKSSADVLNELMSTYSQDTAKASTLISRRAAFEQESDALQAQVVENGTVTNVSASGDVVADDSEDAIRQKYEAEVSELQAKLQSLATELKTLELESEQRVAAARQMESELTQASQQATTLEDAYKVKKRTLDLLPAAEENVSKLQSIATSSMERLLSLGEEWEQHRQPLIMKYRKKKNILQDRKEQVKVKLEQIKIMRSDMKDMVADVRNKEELYTQSLDELNKLPKSINRQIYVRRIMDIVKNLDRQKDDIRTILNDVRTIQKDINMVSETSKRSFAVADELIFQGANRNNNNARDNSTASAASAYKHLNNLRKLFDKIILSVESIGRTKNEIRELTSRIESIESRNTNLNMERIQNDLSQVKKENKALATQIQQSLPQSNSA